MGALRRQSDPRPLEGRLTAWRIERLRSRGFRADLAEAITHDGGYDLHALLELVDRGCPAELAARIAAPFDDDGCGS